MKRTLLSSCVFLASIAHASEKPIEEVVVNAEFRETPLLKTAASISLVDAAQLQARNATHIEDVINTVPNLNFSSGASRGRFFQIRGIGERSQFVDPINPSVGLVVDGIDLTGIGGAATTLDIKQVEVLRGPQGTLFGANALAGLINIVSQDPEEAGGEVRLNLGEYNRREYSHIVSGPISDDVSIRFAVSKNLSDGYMNNSYLDRDDTDNIDETTLRTKLHWEPNAHHFIKLTGLYIDADNGYDGFTLDNSRNTLSDQPGHDRTQTIAASLSHQYTGFDSFVWETLLSGANSDLEYGYDEDWTFRTICPIDSACAFWQYSTFDNYERENDNISFDSRLVSAEGNGFLSWVAGIYFRDQQVDLLRTYTNNDPNYDSFYSPIGQREISLFSSVYETQNIAAYAQFDFSVSDSVDLVLGLRQEHRDADYVDSSGESIDNSENLWGGKFAIEVQVTDDQLIYALISRGYKAGGNNVPGPVDINGDSLIPLVFDTESMWNHEVGFKGQWLDGALQTQVSVFYQDREDIQIKQSLVTSMGTGEVNGDCPCDFTDFISNAAEGKNYGVEFEIDAQINDAFMLWANLGILETEYSDFQSFSHVSADSDTGTPVDLDGRDQAHAPGYQGAIGFDWQFLPYLSWQFDIEAKDGFFLSPRHEEKTESYELLNTRFVYSRDDWELALWGKNLNDEDVIVRGFGSFGNNPQNFYETEAYYQFGAPRTVGISAMVKFK